MNLEQLFISLGYTKEEGILIRNDYSLARTKEDTLITNIKNSYNWFLQFGYTKEDVIKITVSLPTLFAYSKENPRPEKLVIVDESSMMDLSLFYFFLKIIIPIKDTTIIIAKATIFISPVCGDVVRD